MKVQTLRDSYVQPLLVGDRLACRAVIDGAAFLRHRAAYDLLNKLIWPTMEMLQSFYREDHITRSSLNLATRLNRTITDQLSSKLERKESNGRKVLIFCGNDEPEELGGQITADLFECDGWTTQLLPVAECRTTKS